MKSPWLVCIADELSTCLATEMELGATFHGLNKLLADCGDEFEEQLEALNVAVEKAAIACAQFAAGGVRRAPRSGMLVACGRRG
jgi:hypothetical protein